MRYRSGGYPGVCFSVSGFSHAEYLVTSSERWVEKIGEPGSDQKKVGLYKEEEKLRLWGMTC